MSASEDPTEFERRTRELLEASATRLDGRIRSRLTQARHAALEQATRRPAASWLSGWMPAGAVAAAALIATMLWVSRPEAPAAGAVAQAGFEDIDIIADSEALELVESEGYEFYEWAIVEAAANGTDVS